MLTKSQVDRMKYEGEGNPDIRWCDSVPGFGVRVFESGKKSFVLRFAFHGKRQIVTLGKLGVLSLEQARDQAREAYVSIKAGKNPFAKDPTDTITFAEFSKIFLERHASRRKSKEEIKARFDRHLIPQFGKMPLKALNRNAVARYHHDLGQTTPYEANRVLALISVFWEKAIDWGYVDEGTPNPAKRVEKFKEVKRERFVTKDEMPFLLEAIGAEENAYMRAAFQLYLYTGFRKNELLKLEWASVDLVAGRIKLADTKGGRPHNLPLTADAVDLLKGLVRELGNPYVFCGDEPRSHLVDLKSGWRRVKKKAKELAVKGKVKGFDISDVRIHDLRRTVGSWLAMSGHSLHKIGKVLNHQHQATSQIYAHLEESSVREALEGLSGQIAAARVGRGTDK